MAMYDWNHNGKDDMTDNYIEYRIYEESRKKNDSSFDFSGCSTLFWVFFVILGLISLFN